MDISDQSIQTQSSFGDLCDRGVVLALCVAVFVLPFSIALLNSFAVLAIALFLLKRISRLIADWPANAVSSHFAGKACFIWKGFAPAQNPLNAPLQFLALAFFISVLLSQYPGLSLTAFVGKFLKSVFLYFSFIEVFRDEKRIRIFIGVFLASAFVTSLNGVLQHYCGKDLLRGYLLRGGRVNSSFGTANGFGAYLLPAIGVVLHSLYSAAMKKRFPVLAAALTVLLGLLLAGLCWSYSRSSWIGYLAILLVTVLLDWRKAFFAGSLFLIFIFVFPASLSHVRHLFLINDNDAGECENKKSPFDIKSLLSQGGSGRREFWKKAIATIRTSPVYGTGLNTYSRIIMRNPDPKTWWYAHNCYLQLTAETGIFGLVSFLWVLFVLLVHGSHYCRQIKDLWPLTFLQGAVCGLFGFLVQSFFDNTFYTVQLGMLMWLIFGLTSALTGLNQSSEGQGGKIIG